MEAAIVMKQANFHKMRREKITQNDIVLVWSSSLFDSDYISILFSRPYYIFKETYNLFIFTLEEFFHNPPVSARPSYIETHLKNTIEQRIFLILFIFSMLLWVLLRTSDYSKTIKKHYKYVTITISSPLWMSDHLQSIPHYHHNNYQPKPRQITFFPIFNLVINDIKREKNL